MTDDELAEFLGIPGAKEREAILAAITPEERATYEDMARVDVELKLWIEGVGPKPEGVIVCGRKPVPRAGPTERGGDHMTDLYDGAPDGRQAQEPIAPSRFRPRYRQLTDDEKALHDRIKDKAAELEALYNQVAAGRYPALAITALEESVMWIVKGLTA